MPEKLVFEHTLEGLFVRGLGARVTPVLRERLREVGVDLERKLQPAYSFETWCSAVRVAARELHPDVPDDVGYALLGERMVDGYRETVLGRAAFGVIQLLGPRRCVSRARQMFRSGNNYTETRLDDVSPSEVDLWMNEAGAIRYFTQGALRAGLRAVGALHAEVQVRAFTDEGVTYRLTWRTGDEA
ncbi:hypothetical protein BHS09_03365 [Myxococcus xanthus]|uniref:TIGR02265 family protein n=1 Tax=Myxococcus xanthus TaxID=34 RepID=A0AAE6KQI8_MYXXA|nr:DUF2378 family protein [Myxococcus xanthus]QDE66114.1 hypothetical protein BHS09_03365 [Myxococcus xanthus]QDE73386.1 hypothetical protein BHS08_03370 [Myxococcus xanthus]QDF02238.1 hypothetical protein BHS04_03315 [Myxococcus xanthus]